MGDGHDGGAAEAMRGSLSQTTFETSAQVQLPCVGRVRIFLLPCGGGFPKAGLDTALRAGFSARGQEIVVVNVHSDSGSGGAMEAAHLILSSAASNNDSQYSATIIQGWSAGGGAAIQLANDPRFSSIVSGLMLFGAAADGAGMDAARFASMPILQWQVSNNIHLPGGQVLHRTATPPSISLSIPLLSLGAAHSTVSHTQHCAWLEHA